MAKIKVKRGGILKTIDSSEYGIFQAAGFVKVGVGSLGDLTPKEEKEKREELPNLTVEEVQNTDKFVQVADAKESVVPPTSEVVEDRELPELDKDGCVKGVCELEEKPAQQQNKNKNKQNKNR